jgi:hypothetical protein
MPTLPPQHQQIVQAHAAFICRFVELSQNAASRPALEELLRGAEDAGWTRLVAALRLIAAGRRDPGTLAGLDEEDTVIAEAILRGLADPATLPDPQHKPDGAFAAPGLAGLIHAAARGDAQALVVLSHMAEQMSRAGGEMARLAGLVRRLVNGERDAGTLGRGLSVRTRQLLHSILEELGRLDRH